MYENFHSCTTYDANCILARKCARILVYSVISKHSYIYIQALNAVEPTKTVEILKQPTKLLTRAIDYHSDKLSKLNTHSLPFLFIKYNVRDFFMWYAKIEFDVRIMFNPLGNPEHYFCILLR